MLPTAMCCLLWLLLAGPAARAQQRCATVEHNEKLHNTNRVLEQKDQFEQWLSKKILQRRKEKGTHLIQSTYQVPVVVHVIHNGEAVGTGTNISSAQVLSQIAVLNKDYNRLNTDADETPAEFLPVAAGMNIEFVMARRTPDGFATDGIVRTKGSKTSWGISDDELLKSQSYWPAEDYLNIWVCNLFGYLGYAQFPVSDLPGLEDPNYNRLTDGAVFSYKAFGSIDDGPFNLDPQYNRGRTATHELGHFFGLRHIWGDDTGCSGTDYVNDTPNQDSETYNCPSHPRVTCTVTSMFMNFLDYTDDVCMNLFTADQVGRMVSVLENSPRRKSLLTSPGLLDSDQEGNDLAITKVITPSPVTCETRIRPVLEVLVSESVEPITSFNITYSINQGTLQTASFTDLTLNEGDKVEVTLPQIILSDETTLSFEVREPNGSIDINSQNNTATIAVVVNAAQETIPLTEDFEQAYEETWTITNPLNGMTWQQTTLGANQALYFNAFTNSTVGDQAWLVAPSVDLSGTTKATVTFDWSYAVRPNFADRFAVLASTDCGNTFTELHSLPLTGETSTSAWTPAASDDWNAASVEVNDYAGLPDVRFAFVFTNGNGNNFYLDNVGVYIPARFALYPNPTTDVVNIAFNLSEPEAVTIDIMDMWGKTLGQQTVADAGAQEVSYSLGTLAPGMYLVRVQSSHGVWVSKVIVNP